MAAPTVPVDSLPEIVRDSELKVQFVREGTKNFIIHTHTARRRSAEEKWLVKQHLRAGGQGSVDLQTRVVGEPEQPSIRAVKRILIPDIQKVARSKMYQRELETIAKFSQAKFSKLFVTSYGWYLSPGCINIAMEYCELGDLNKYLQDRSSCPENRLPESDTQEITYQVLEALSTMHEERFCHRDLKLANILIKRTGPRWWVKLADFGLSKRGGDDTTTNFSAGSRGYMSPEISFKGYQSDVDHYAVDMWSLGQVVARLLTGQVLFPTHDDLGRYYFHGTGFPEQKLKKHNATSNLVDFVRGLTKIKPAERLTTRTALEHPWMDMAANIVPPGEDEKPFTRTRIDSDDPSNVWPDGFGGQPKDNKGTRDTTETPSNVWPDQQSTGTGGSKSATEKEAEIHKDTGNQFFKQEEYDLAIEQYTKAIELMPTSAVYLSNRAAAYMAHFRWEDALTDCLKAVDLEVPAPKLRLRLGRIYTRLGRPEEALPIYEQIRPHVREKDTTRATNMLECVQSAQRALSVGKDYPSVLSWIDKAKVDLGTLAPIPRAWKLLQVEAYIHIRQQGKGYDTLAEASQLLEELLLKDYNDTEALFLRSRIAVTLALKPYSTEQSSTEPTATDESSQKPADAEDAEDATQSVPGEEQPKESASDDDSDVDAFAQLVLDTLQEIVRMKEVGNEAYKRGEFAKAREIYSDALAIWPTEEYNNARVFLNRAQTHIKLGDYQESIKDCERAMNLDQSYEKPHAVKARAEKLLKEMGQKGEAESNGSDGGVSESGKDSPQVKDEGPPTICPTCGESFKTLGKFINHARELNHFVESEE